MTQLEDLLRRALAETPTPDTTFADPVARVERRARRTRVLVASVMTAAVTAVAVAVPIALTRSGGSTSPAPLPPLTQAPPGTTQLWKSSGVEAVTAGDGLLWALATEHGPNDEYRVLAAIDPRTRTVMHRVNLPAPIDFVTFGEGKVWAFGGGDGAYPDSVVDVIDPVSGKVIVSHAYPRHGAPRGIAFAQNRAWISLATANRIDEVDVSSGRWNVVSSTPVPHQPWEIVTTGDGRLWVRESLSNRIAEIVIGAGAPRVAHSYAWSEPLYAPAGAGSVWTSDGPSRVVQLSPGILGTAQSAALGVRILAPRPVSAVAPAAGGLYVAVMTDQPDADAPVGGVAYYSTAALRSSDPKPTAYLTGAPSASIAALPDGSVAIVRPDGVIRWAPGAGSLR